MRANILGSDTTNHDIAQVTAAAGILEAGEDPSSRKKMRSSVFRMEIRMVEVTTNE